MNTRWSFAFVCLFVTLLALLPGAEVWGLQADVQSSQGILPTATPWPAPTTPPAQPPKAGSGDLPVAEAPVTEAPVTEAPVTEAPVIQVADGNRPVPTYLPVLMRHFRPQAPMLGVALEGFFDAAGWQETLALQPRYARRWREIAWRDIEPQEGQYRWDVLEGLEQELRTAAAAAAVPILNVQMTPPWAQKHQGYACGPIAKDKFEAFARLMEQLVTRYGSNSEYNVRYWQIGNEPDVAVGLVAGDSVFGCWGDAADPYYGGGYYGEMLNYIYPRIKAADPKAQVMLGGLLLECDPYTMQVPESCINEERLRSGYFLEGVLKAGAIDSFDVADVHGYGELHMELPSRMSAYYFWSPAVGGTGLPEKVGFVRRLLAQYGVPGKPIMATELALKCEEPGTDCEEVGAAYIPRVFAEAYQLRLAGTVYYALITEFKYKGLLLPDMTRKPQYWAFKYLASQFSSVEYVKPVDQFAGISGSEFNRSRLSRLWILWSSDGTDQYLTPPPDFMQVNDKYGNVLQLVDGRIPVGWSPVYVHLKLASEAKK